VHGTGASSLVDRYAEVLTPTGVDPELALLKPVHAHRLDAPVGGLLIVAKTQAALKKLK
jgi:23S rRNA-/tRNA-specific pseudouridylate synthase